MGFVDTNAIGHLLQPFIDLDEMRLRAISTYVDILLKWNARINLTAIRKPEEIIQRHFGESLFVAKYVLAQKPVAKAIDLGSGAGFPGVPFALLAPEAEVTLIEASQKKATFLRELIYTLDLKNAKVYGDRGERFPGRGDLVMLRAVEKFEKALVVARSLAEPGGRIALMVGQSQVEVAVEPGSQVQWREPIAIPSGNSRALLLGTTLAKVEQG
jgi:16S rRNA (guanine527-N7)-methyltransferase